MPEGPVVLRGLGWLMVLYRLLDQVALEDLSEFGGKAVRLGEAMRLGCPVLPGLVLSTELFRRFMGQGGLQGEIASILSTLQPSTLLHFQAAEWAIREAFRVRRMPDEVARTIREAWVLLNCPSVLVRSSATHEHGPRHTFVGQHESYLGVSSVDAAIEAVVGCWMSLFSAKALAYAHRFEVDLLGSAMAVLLQPMIFPTAKGMLFTVDPISGNPDTFILETQEGPSTGTFYLDPYAQGDDETPVWTELRRLGLLLDEHALFYQAVEWAISDGRLYLLRVFPVTKVPPYLPIAADDVGAGHGPLELVRPPGSRPRAMRPYSWYHRSRSQRLNTAYLHRAHRLFLPYTERDEYYLCGYLYARWRRLTSTDLSGEDEPLRHLLLSLRQILAARTLDREFRALWREKRPRLDALNEIDVTTLSNHDLSRYLEELMALSEAFHMQGGRLGDSHSAIPNILLGLHRRWLGDSGDLWTLFGEADDQVRRRDRALYEVAQATYSGDAEREAAFQAFFRRYRHLYLQGEPLAEQQDICALREDESAARAVLQACQQDGGRAWRELVSRRTEGVQEAERRVLGRLKGARRAIYRYVLGLARRYFPLRADRDEPVLLSWVLERDVVFEVGRRLCAIGAASRPEDASFLGCRELVDYLEGRISREEVVAMLTEREALFRKWWRYAPPDVLEDTHPPLDVGIDSSVDADDLLRGLAVSPGMAEGRARVTNTLLEAANLLPGEVLVCRAPLFELSPLFGVALAVVAESGTLLGHAAILAREYGVPAVFSVERAAERIRNGEELRVDGGEGLVIRRHVEPELELL